MAGVPENCDHGIRLRGPNPPRCIECEIVWEVECLTRAQVDVLRHGQKLFDLRAELHGFTRTRPVSDQIKTKPGE